MSLNLKGSVLAASGFQPTRNMQYFAAVDFRRGIHHDSTGIEIATGACAGFIRP